jgi:hypothetical protein
MLFRSPNWSAHVDFAEYKLKQKARMLLTNLISAPRQVTWRENWETCCSIGMMPVIIESMEESQCLVKNFPSMNMNTAYSPINKTKERGFSQAMHNMNKHVLNSFFTPLKS